VMAAPLIVALVLGRVLEPNQLAWFGLAATPLLCASVPLGQGMIVWAYTELREPLLPPPPASAPVRRWARAWTWLIVLPITSLLLLELSLWRPSRVPAGEAPSGELLAQLVPDEGTQRVLLPNTALELSATLRQVSVAASDGGGVGPLPLMAAEPIERVRIVRLRDAFAVELQQGHTSYVTFVDRAGVRLDDDLRARLLDRVSPLQLAVFLFTLLLTGIASVPVLNGLGRVVRHERRPGPARSQPEGPGGAGTRESEHTRGVRRARNLAILLVPLSLTCLVMALRALAGS
ncbi:MAG: hypothetical protein ABW321_27245, partial [Polyangiales bacterium]